MEFSAYHSNTKLQVWNRDAIKYLAMVTMLLNHIALIFLTAGSASAEILTDIGYFTAPTMCYFLVEGYEYTHSRRQYGLRLLVFALLSQIPYTLAFQFGNLNMMFTLLCCFLILAVMEKYPRPLQRIPLCIALMLITIISDWALLAPLYTILFRNSQGDRRKLMRSFGVAYLLFAYFNISSHMMRPDVTTQEAVLLGMLSGIGILASGTVILFFYNGKRAQRGRKFSKWFFYLFYPVHLTILYLIKITIAVQH